MPGKRITNLQVKRYKELRRKYTQAAAAAKTGLRISTARRINGSEPLPSQRPPRHWRTRSDRVGEVWSTEIVPMLEGAPSSIAITLLEELQRRYASR